jgi:hypothetical protein
MCNTSDPHEMHRQNCNGFEVLPTEDCYAVNHPDWKMFFEDKYANEWNFLSGWLKLSTKSGGICCQRRSFLKMWPFSVRSNAIKKFLPNGV